MPTQTVMDGIDASRYYIDVRESAGVTVEVQSLTKRWLLQCAIHKGVLGAAEASPHEGAAAARILKRDPVVSATVTAVEARPRKEWMAPLAESIELRRHSFQVPAECTEDQRKRSAATLKMQQQVEEGRNDKDTRPVEASLLGGCRADDVAGQLQGCQKNIAMRPHAFAWLAGPREAVPQRLAGLLVALPRQYTLQVLRVRQQLRSK
mmetsp:Transcript_39018/g.125404  ORF Transcript_39018/g.125404 Transcript_39018/m.125404 type:complete len:207 (-) Transcript_39018:529-1149(-)